MESHFIKTTQPNTHLCDFNYTHFHVILKSFNLQLGPPVTYLIPWKLFFFLNLKTYPIHATSSLGFFFFYKYVYINSCTWWTT